MYLHTYSSAIIYRNSILKKSAGGNHTKKMKHTQTKMLDTLCLC